MFHLSRHINIISDTEILSTIARVVSGIVQGSVQDGIQVHKINNWVAVPVESALHFDDLDIQRISTASQHNGNNVVYGYALEDSPQIPKLISFNSTTEGINAFNSSCSHANYAVFPLELSWLVLCLTEGVYVVIGPLHFVEDAIGGSIEAGYSAFQTYASDQNWPSGVRERFLYVLETFKDTYSTIKTGGHISL